MSVSVTSTGNLQLPTASSDPLAFFFPFPKRPNLRSTLLFALCRDFPMPSPPRRPFRDPWRRKVAASSGPRTPTCSMLGELMSFEELPLNQRTRPLNLPEASRSELESDRRVFSLCLGVSVGRML